MCDVGVHFYVRQHGSLQDTGVSDDRASFHRAAW